MLMLNASVRTVARADLAGLPVPRRTRTHRPVPHADAADALVEAAEDRGLKVRSEDWTITDGATYPTPGQRIHVPAARMYGVIDFERPAGFDIPDGILPSAGVRNSHDKRHSLTVLAGGRVICCSNGLAIADFTASRRHTSGISLSDAVGF